jgi:hypothetical protein
MSLAIRSIARAWRADVSPITAARQAARIGHPGQSGERVGDKGVKF